MSHEELVLHGEQAQAVAFEPAHELRAVFPSSAPTARRTSTHPMQPFGGAILKISLSESDAGELDKVQVTCHGGFAYLADVLSGGEQLSLFACATADQPTFGFVIFSAARERC